MYDERALQLASDRHGVVAVWELRRAGVSQDAIRQLYDSRHWERVDGVVLRRVGSPATRGQRLATAVLGCGPDSAATGLGAGRWWGLSGCRQWPLPVVGVRWLRRTPDDVAFRQVRRLPPSWTTQLDGVPIVRPELCALHLFADCSPERACRLVDSLWSMRLLSGPSIDRFLRDMGAMGRNGTAGLRDYLAARGPEYVPPASRLEDRAWEILAGAGIEVRRQVDLGSQAEWTGRVDGIVVGTHVVIEIQSWRYHGALVDRDADRVRIARLVAAGFTVVEITDDEVWSQPAVVVRKVQDGIAAARALRRPR
jgi:very-short-patch-repair endonuclease